MYQLKEALVDPLTWAIVFYALVADIPNGGITNFFSQLITSFGYVSHNEPLVCIKHDQQLTRNLRRRPNNPSSTAPPAAQSK